MNFRPFIIYFFIIFFLSCGGEKKYIPKGLIKLSEKEIIHQALNKKDIAFEKVIYKNEYGEIITLDSIRNLPNMSEWTSDRYADKNGVIKEMIIRKATKKDKEFLKKMQQAYNYEPPIKLIDIDCEKKGEILEEIYSLDQNMRLIENEIDAKIDRQNLIKVISLIEKCGMPTTKQISAKQMNTIWLVLQHADNENRKKYFKILKKSAKNGDLSEGQIAIMQDRILMMDGKPQIYGSQIVENKETRKWEIYNLKNSKLVDKRRAKVGLSPLDEYVKKWNIEFNVEQKN